MNQKLKVINLYGAPGMGKSATRAGLFWLMKVKGMSVEEVNEYAKYLVLSQRTWQLERDQLYVLAKQHHKLLILEGQYEYALTDSPLLLSSFYSDKNHTPSGFDNLCVQYYSQFENINFFLTRDLTEEKFEEVGRIHNQQQSLELEKEQRDFLDSKGVNYSIVQINDITPWTILDQLEQKFPGSVPKKGPLRPESY